MPPALGIKTLDHKFPPSPKDFQRRSGNVLGLLLHHVQNPDDGHFSRGAGGRADEEEDTKVVVSADSVVNPKFANVQRPEGLNPTPVKVTGMGVEGERQGMTAQDHAVLDFGKKPPRV